MSVTGARGGPSREPRARAGRVALALDWPRARVRGRLQENGVGWLCQHLQMSELLLWLHEVPACSVSEATLPGKRFHLRTSDNEPKVFKEPSNLVPRRISHPSLPLAD